MDCSGDLFVDVSHGTGRAALVMGDDLALDRGVGLVFATDFVPGWAPFLLPVVLVTCGSTLGMQVYRYVRLYDATQRQQVKWFLFAFFMGLSLEIVGNGVLGELVAPLNAPD